MGCLYLGGARLGHRLLWSFGLSSDSALLARMVHLGNLGCHYLSFRAECAPGRVFARHSSQNWDCRDDTGRCSSDGHRVDRMVQIVGAVATLLSGHSECGRLGRYKWCCPKRHCRQMVRARSPEGDESGVQWRKCRGVLFVPLWLFLIDWLGFQTAALAVSIVALGVMGWISIRYFRLSPTSLGLSPDGNGVPTVVAKPTTRLSRSSIIRMPGFLTLSAAFALGLFAQIGLLSHLVSRLTPDVGATTAGLLLSLATACAVIGRTLTGWWIGDHDRRIAAAINFAVQTVGVLLLIFGNGWIVLTFGCVIFGFGIGNLTTLPPLIAQKEFDRKDVVAVVALIVAINQAVFAFAPAIVGALRDATSGYGTAFGIVACIQLLAAMVVLLGRKAVVPPARSA